MTRSPALGELTLVTGNENKHREAERLSGRSLIRVSLDLPEIQSLDLHEILREKAREAQRRIGRPVIVEETAFELSAMNGFPGPLVKWMLAAVGCAGIARIGSALGDAGARARCALMALSDDAEVVSEGVTEGMVVDPPRGERGFGWDPIFRPEGLTQTYGEMGPETKDRIGHRGRAWRSFLDRLES